VSCLQAKLRSTFKNKPMSIDFSAELPEPEDIRQSSVTFWPIPNIRIQNMFGATKGR